MFSLVQHPHREHHYRIVYDEQVIGECHRNHADYRIYTASMSLAVHWSGDRGGTVYAYANTAQGAYGELLRRALPKMIQQQAALTEAIAAINDVLPTTVEEPSHDGPIEP